MAYHIEFAKLFLDQLRYLGFTGGLEFAVVVIRFLMTEMEFVNVLEEQVR
jgi:hypothetical protein